MPGTRAPTQRLFVAFPVPDPVAHALSAWLAVARAGQEADRHQGLRWTRPEGWHLTLAFLGDVPSVGLEAIVDRVGDVLARHPLPGRLIPDRPGRFGTHVLWLGVRDEPGGRVADLGARIQAALATGQLPVTRRAVIPHVTLARARRGARVTDDTVAALARHDPPATGWQPGAVHVVASELGDGPARYRTVARVLPPPDDRQRGAGPPPQAGS